MRSTALKEDNQLVVLPSRLMKEVFIIEKSKNNVQDNSANKFKDRKCGFERLYKSNPEVTFIEHYEKMYGFHYDEYIKIAYKFLLDTQMEYRFLVNKVKLFYSRTSLTEFELRNYFIKSRPIKTCKEESVKQITDLLLSDNEKIKIEYFEKGHYGDIKVYCTPQNMPDHIYILTDKIQKVYDLKYLLHELGHAIPLSKTLSNLVLLRGYSYNEIMQEAYAYLYEDLVIYNSDFRETYKIMLSHSDIENCRLEDLYNMRLLAAKIIYQKEYFSNDNESYLRTFYQDMIQKSLLVDINNSTYSNASDTSFLTTQNFVGKIIASKIQLNIESSFGLGWYKNQDAAIALNNLFSHGGLVTPNNYENFLFS